MIIRRQQAGSPEGLSPFGRRRHASFSFAAAQRSVRLCPSAALPENLNETDGMIYHSGRMGAKAGRPTICASRNFTVPTGKFWAPTSCEPRSQAAERAPGKGCACNGCFQSNSYPACIFDSH